MKSRVTTAIVMLALLAVCAIDVVPVLAQAVAPGIAVPIDGEYGPHLPPDISTHGHRIDSLINTLHYFMVALFVGWGVFFTYCLVRFRQRSGHKANTVPVKAKVSKWLEVGVAGFEAFLLIGLSIPVWGSVKNDLPTEADNPVHIRVVAEQFQWNFHYAGPDGVFGKTAPQHINMATNLLGIDPSDPNGADDIVSAELHFPVNRKVLCRITSKDVIHSFFVPVLRIKQDAIPGMSVPVWFEATKTGNYEVACAQLCGNNHYSMRALMTVHANDAEFAAWLDSQKVEDFDENEFED